MNHNEPDHSGALAKLYEIAPQIQVLSSQAGCIYLKEITNNAMIPLRAVKDGELLDIGGGKALKFISAPFLHWPDSMFTWLESEKTAFTCDFLGTHYCEPRMFDRLVAYPRRYEEAFEGYYQAIFAPFKPYVLKGLEKLKALDIEYVCTSHGPILTKGVFLEEALDRYRSWSVEKRRERRYIPLFYCSAYGNTQILAENIAEGIKSVMPQADVEVLDINDHDMQLLAQKINQADAFLLGSPTINRDAVPPVLELTACIDAVNTKGKLAAAFGSFGWSGEAVPALYERFRFLRLEAFENGLTCRFVPSNDEIEEAIQFGRRFAHRLQS